jgi:hypothetical protein
MPKVTMPLMSGSATGTLGKKLTYSSNDQVRAWCKPANPMTEGQGDARQKFAAVQAAMKLAGAAAILAIKAVAPIPAQWNSYMVGKCIGRNSALFDAYLASFTALTSEQKAAWDATFTAIFVPEIAYALMDLPSDGAAAWVVCSALFANSIITSPGTPAAANSAAWETALTAET